MATPPPGLDLLVIAEHLEDVTGTVVGGYVCIERRNRPWRVLPLIAVDEDTLTTEGDYRYDRKTGQPLFESEQFSLHPLTQERLEYLMIAEALKAAEKIKVNVLTPEEKEEFLPAARLILGLATRLGQGGPSRLFKGLRTARDRSPK
ncbi:hypothetical protein LAJ19_10820 [Deinococcus taeanensis]|uniref:hypothetical protein n=1 Tax=Deinococcus taeanensis TaxID=2737050 RepID=UPI001CDD5B4C|nr:hypothetical protein [Deinococcus taeanensis]UBV42121.1 hypothetical protein LAJ19_10820 [Deinococcus taeanensis]